jgi:uncharacterized protein
MKLYDKNQKTGHLLAFFSKKKRGDNFSIFLPVRGLEEFDSLLEVTGGFEKCHKEMGLHEEYNLLESSLDDVAKVSEIIPEIDEKRMVRFDVSQFIDEKSQFIPNFAQTILKRLASRTDPIWPDIRTGAIATGASFYDRERDVSLIWEKLTNGRSLLLRSPRRYGKSSLLKYIQQNPRESWNVCYVDLGGDKSAEDYIERILDGLIRYRECNVCLPAHLSACEPWKKNEADKRTLRLQERGKIKDHWKDYGHALFESMNSTEKKMLLILDEFSYMIEDIIATGNMDEVGSLMTWFHDERRKMKNLSFILSGSEHLPLLLEKYGIRGHIDDLENVHLTLFDDQTARELIFLLLTKEGVSGNLPEINKILNLMGDAIPFFLQVFVDLLCSICREKGEVTLEDIESIYYQQLIGPDSKRHFESVEQQLYRYDRYKPHGRSGAEGLLNQLSVRDRVDRGDLEAIWSEKTGSADKFDTILGVMKDDFYISERDGSVCLTSKLIKDWWAKHGN